MIDLSKLHVIAVISNPMRYQSRWDLYKQFAEDIQRKGANLWTLEVQTGARIHQVTEGMKDEHTQLWASSLPGEVWHKEGMINAAIQQLTIFKPDWRYVAWVDADIRFEQGMLGETAHALQHWDIVQMWSHAVDLGPEDEMINTHKSFMYCYWTGELPSGKTSKAYDAQGHPGYAWAARREAVNKLGGLIDWAILGSADRHMACALVGKVLDSAHGNCHKNYLKHLKIWQDRAEREIKRNVGYVPGTLRHYWHGDKSRRGYNSRWKILVDYQFNPETDIKRDVNGLWQLVTTCQRQMNLRDAIRKYMSARNEDATTRG